MSDAVLPLGLFDNARPYTKRVVRQLNAAYEISLFDCAAVMIRRLLETLIIEVYEELGRAEEIKRDLLKFIRNDTLNLSRPTINGLEDFKKLGNLSAHNRKFNAKRNDIDRIRDGLRVASEELLHLCNQGPSV